MTDEKPRVIIIPPKPELQQTAVVTKQLRVAAYCRVSTKEEEQGRRLSSPCALLAPVAICGLAHERSATR